MRMLTWKLLGDRRELLDLPPRSRRRGPQPLRRRLFGLLLATCGALWRDFGRHGGGPPRGGPHLFGDALHAARAAGARPGRHHASLSHVGRSGEASGAGLRSQPDLRGLQPGAAEDAEWPLRLREVRGGEWTLRLGPWAASA